ncbi:MAG TPA: hypothetical protein DET40_23325 [Lentisphaeria bacterium]|nr:MAG: hypothetical protein A2X45_24600 [Lentisphaerae bacterium GWF2_50_93]HCE46487.1 hypothetical protein [Lentisphaeria bacterium]
MESLVFNKKQGSFVPPAWLVESFGDHALFLLFPIFESYSVKETRNFKKFAAKRLSELDWGKQKYLEKHVCEIAVKLEKEIRGKPFWATGLA